MYCFRSRVTALMYGADVLVGISLMISFPAKNIKRLVYCWNISGHSLSDPAFAVESV